MMSSLRAWQESGRKTRRSSNAGWFVTHALILDLTEAVGAVGRES